MDKIDFVIAWVDGSDPKWGKEREKYNNIVDSTQDVDVVRYRDWENLQYWLRAVEKYAPWVNRIHFLTWGHIPNWLNLSNPKLNIVRHEDYIPKEYLPTFNSHTIELNMHRIKGLSEKFVYFNDDMFLTNYVKKEDFFKNGLPCDTFALDTIFFEKESAGAYIANNMEIINKHFEKDIIQKKLFWKKWFKIKYGINKLYRTMVLSKWHYFPGFFNDHLPTSLLKSTLEEVWNKEKEVLHNTCLDKFRSKRNVNQWIFKYWNLASGNFYPRKGKFGRCFHLIGKYPYGIQEVIEKKKYYMVCLNDTPRIKSFETHKKIINSSFEKVLSEKSSFEK